MTMYKSRKTIKALVGIAMLAAAISATAMDFTAAVGHTANHNVGRVGVAQDISVVNMKAEYEQDFKSSAGVATGTVGIPITLAKVAKVTPYAGFAYGVDNLKQRSHSGVYGATIDFPVTKTIGVFADARRYTNTQKDITYSAGLRYAF